MHHLLLVVHLQIVRSVLLLGVAEQVVNVAIQAQLLGVSEASPLKVDCNHGITLFRPFCHRVMDEDLWQGFLPNLTSFWCLRVLLKMLTVA